MPLVYDRESDLGFQTRSGSNPSDIKYFCSAAKLSVVQLTEHNGLFLAKPEK
jgi:hypothetical protein